MLDLGFVREHLDLVEKKLRDRGLDPVQVLGDFRQLDADRRALITEAETLKAKQNKASEQVAQRKREKQDAADLIAAMKGLREQVGELERRAAEKDAELRNLLAGIPNLPNDSVPVGKTADDNV
ncbi:MAG TPA: hypothetical protein VL382_12000, partial [Terriglobales bacterium]|nr:hypothetical protein [Terriglobales bacterium]